MERASSRGGTFDLSSLSKKLPVSADMAMPFRRSYEYEILDAEEVLREIDAKLNPPPPSPSEQAEEVPLPAQPLGQGSINIIPSRGKLAPNVFNADRLHTPRVLIDYSFDDREDAFDPGECEIWQDPAEERNRSFLPSTHPIRHRPSYLQHLHCILLSIGRTARCRTK
ncbi:hypothetical protein BT69DRAFT_140035 [Atractiella rhizophila]|nr:hypothetical protein BT69DRAFT_140035 [Atractiella rhizophila]